MTFSPVYVYTTSLRNDRKPPSMKKQLSKKIKLLRSKMGLSQADMAKIAGVAKNRIWSWETGDGAPSSSRMKALIKLGKKHDIEFTMDDVLEIGRGDNKKKL